MKPIAVSAIVALTAIFLYPLACEIAQRVESSTETTVNAKEYEPMIFQISGGSGVFVVGEELVYNVSYSVFDLGSVKFQVLDTVRKFGTTVYIIKVFIDSYSGVPFVTLHQVFYSEMTVDPYTYVFSIHNTATPDAIPFTKYYFDYNKKKVSYEIGVEPQNVVSKKGEEVVTGLQQDGLSLLYYARVHCKQVKKITTPIFVNEKTFFTKFNFMNKIGVQEIDAVSYPVETVEFDGTADFTGIFGLTGYFRGFFSNDEASIPIVAKMKVLLGSIHIELIKWNRPGWIPPRGKK